MLNCRFKYEQRFVAFVDILGFHELVKHSVKNDDADSIGRMIHRLAPDADIELYKQTGAEVCPDSRRINHDLAVQITQVSDCVIISAEISPAGAINIINYCRKVAERLLLREHVLCRGYLTMGAVYHEGTTIFGTAYQEAVDGERRAAAIEWGGGTLGTPFIEINNSVADYLAEKGNECTRKLLPRLTFPYEDYLVVSPYGIFSRMVNWAVSPNKTPDEIRREIDYALQGVDKIQGSLTCAKPLDKSGREKIRISLDKLAEARSALNQALNDVEMLESPFPARH